MTKKDILNLATKILGVYLLIIVLWRIEVILYFIISLFQSGGFKLNILQAIIVIIPFVVYICIAMLFIKKSDLIVQKLNLQDDQEVTKININKDEFQESVYSIVGIVLISNALIKIPQQAIHFANPGSFGGKFAILQYGGAIGILFQIIIGMYLVFGSRGLVGLINKFKR